MRWIVAVLALTVIGAIFGSATALVLGWPSLKVPRGDPQVVSLGVKDSGPAQSN
jgi:hypothetical protein